MKRLPSVLRLLILFGVLFFAVSLRFQGLSTLPAGQFTDTDAYLFLHQASIVSSEGHLPVRDTARWLPVGRDHRESLNLYPIVLGSVHKWVSLFFGEVSLYRVVLFAPVVCFFLTLVAWSVFFWRRLGAWLAIAVCVYLATLPGSIERSAAGFGDRDAWCLLIGSLSVVTYLTAAGVRSANRRLVWTLISGLCVYIGASSWEGFGVFTLLLTTLEMWRFLTSETEDVSQVGLYSLWVSAFSVPLLLTSGVYSLGGSQTDHLFSVITGNLGVLVLLPPMVLLVLRWVRWFLLFREPFASRLKPHAHRLPALLLLVSLCIGGVSVLLMRHGLLEALTALRENPLRYRIGELAPPHFGYWCFRYGSLFLIGSVGAVVAVIRLFGRDGYRLAGALASFAVLSFFRQPVHAIFGDGTGNAFFYISMFACLFYGCQVAIKGVRFSMEPGVAYTVLVMLLWFLIWVGLSQSAKRFDFFIGLALSFFTAQLFEALAGWISGFFANPKWTTEALRQRLPAARLRVGIATLIGLAALVWGPTGGHIFRAYHAATQLRHASPGEHTPLSNALSWIQTHLPETSVVAAEWSYGTQLNVLGGVKTITDSDHYIPHWIDLYEQTVRQTRQETTALTFLLTHGATHVMVTEKHPTNTLLRGHHGALSDAFILRYPQPPSNADETTADPSADVETAPVRIYELRYPKVLKSDPKYLLRRPETRTPEIEHPPHAH